MPHINPTRLAQRILGGGRNANSEVSPSPTRLVDMGFIATGRVKIVEPRKHTEQITGRYVTLSHCWGDIEFYHLSNDTLAHFEDGIDLDKLPKTFHHAIDFACRLGVRYIWIDSLCILQDSTKDWLYQSAQMDQVYNNSLCNISATAARNSSEGLYVDRDSKQHWIDEVNLNTANGADPPKKYTVLDLDFWETAVGQAPVNRRGWVLQERMIAPRVLHFCHDQIAWECWEMDAIESRPNGIPLLQLKSGSIVRWSRFKGLVPSVDGKALRDARLSLWKRIVENYSRLRLTKGTDKLIALAGIAKIMSRRIFNGRDEDYIAGMWRANLESQLLWRVDPALKKDKTYDFHSDRPSMDEYRAPSFSWAAID
ncbi:HET-domain-containing protein, partial [Cadophora sp. DSE1049]